MHYSFCKVKHKIVKLHQFFEHTVLEVWGKPNGTFKIEMLHEDFRPLVEKTAKNKNDYLFKPIRKIYNRFKELPQGEVDDIIESYKSNTAIQELCLGKKTPLDYAWLDNIDKTLSKNIKRFCTDLYKHILTKTDKEFEEVYGTLSDYYYELLEANKPKEVCPFCGLIKLKSKKRKGRDAFDHYFPKGHYPFASIHLLNLFPTCDDCNSCCKKQKKPTYSAKEKKRRKAFFPFSQSIPPLDIEVDVNYIDPFDCSKNKVSFKFKNTTHKQEIKTWRDLYNIDERYEEELCSSDAKAWLEEMQNHIRLYGKKSAKNHLAPLRNNKLNNRNFLRVPFVEECMKQDIVSA